MAKRQHSDVELPPSGSRSNSFVQMLKLEKKFKIQRGRQDDTSSTTSPASTTAPTAHANPPPFRARRFSAHPPLSHQTQIMKASKRGSDLPSLSVSIPTSPTGPRASEQDASSETLQFESGKPDRARVVTFSNPEQDDDELSLSDQSSICQSPSWEQYGRKKKKPSKKEADPRSRTKSSEDQNESKSKRKSNRLSKVPPQVQLRVSSVAATTRSQSAPELDLYLKTDHEISHFAQPAVNRDAMANQPTTEHGLTPDISAKPKGRGFLSNFRLQHGNVAAVQKIIEKSRASVDEHRASQDLRPVAPPMQKSYSVGPGLDIQPTTSGEPPSIRSFVSNSTHSSSSQDKRARPSSSSSHGRSQSLLSATLNKLKGPSYLYYQSPADAEGSHARSLSGSNEAGDPRERIQAEPSDQSQVKRGQQMMAVRDPIYQPPGFVFPPSTERETNEPPPEIAPRARPPRARRSELREIASAAEVPTLFQSKGRRIQLSDHPQSPMRDSVMAQIIAQEKQSQAGRISQQAKRHTANWEADDNLKEVRNREHAAGRQLTDRNIDVSTIPLNSPTVMAEPSPGVSPKSEDSTSSIEVSHARDPNRVDRHPQDDDRTSVVAHTSTVSSASQAQDRNMIESSGKFTASNPRNTSRLAVTDREAEIWNTNSNEAVLDLIRPGNDLETPLPTQDQSQQRTSADYFTFINELYAPPALELRSPLAGSPSSTKTLEESEDDEDDFFRNHPLRHHIDRSAGAKESTGHAHQYLNSPRLGMTAKKTLQEQKPRYSPAISAHLSDSDVPAFERLGLSSKAAKILVGAETASTSTTRSQLTEPGNSTSGRSSSEAPPSPSTESTPDHSRPQSLKEHPQPNAQTAPEGHIRPSTHTDERTSRSLYRSSIERHADSAGQPNGNHMVPNGESASIPPDIKQPTLGSNHLEIVTSKAALVTTTTSVTFADSVQDDSNGAEVPNRSPRRISLPPRAYSALDLHSTKKPVAPPKRQFIHSTTKANASSVSLPSSPPPESADGIFPRKSALKMSRNNSEESSALVSAGAAYLQEARRAALAPPVPPSRALRPLYAHKNSSGNTSVASEKRAEPLAKILVECCSCKFFHDMPSRVYECMAKPDSVVEDKLLGVSAAITTTVKCPWCGHGMTTQCCSGYAAVIYLKEKLHGK